MKKSTTKRALLMSVLSMFLCFTMLIGTTFAWFTDEVESGVNTIVAGNLDVDVLVNDEDEGLRSIEQYEKLFNDIKLWEPGAVAYENITVVNKGNLALKYQLEINFANENTVNGFGLSDVLQVAVVEGGVKDQYADDRDALVNSIDNWQLLDTWTESGKLFPKAADGTIDPDKPFQQDYAIVIWWQPSDNDNNFNVNNGKTTSDGEKALHIDLGVSLFATQLEAEMDSFGNDYDKDAIYTDVVVASEAELKEALANAKNGAVIGIKGNVTWTTGAGIGSTPFVEAVSTYALEATVNRITLVGIGEDATFTAIGAGVGGIGIDNGTVTFKNLKIVDESVSYAESNWEYGYLEFRGNTVFEDCDIVNAIMMEGDSAKFVNCTFNSNKTKEYAVWVANGNVSFDGCTFTGPRSLKTHEAYGSEVGVITVTNCEFVEISEKPGMAIGTVNADTTITFKSNKFIGTQAGDQGLYSYETDTDVNTFNFTFADDNEVITNDGSLATGLYKGEDGTLYATTNGGLNAGINEAKDGDTIVLAQDIVYTGNGYANITKNITLDLGGNTLSTTSLGVVAKAGTIKNGVVSNPVGSLAALRTWSGVSIENVVVNAPENGGITVASGNTLPYIKNVTINSKTYGIELQYGASVGSIENVNIVAGENGIVAQAATIGNISNCVIEAKNAGIFGQLKGVYDLKITLDGTNEINGGKYGIYLFDEGANIVPDGSAYLAYGNDAIKGGVKDKEFAFAQTGKLFINGSKIGAFISSADELFAFAKAVNVDKNNFKGLTVMLTADIDLENKAWTPIGQTGATEFKGIFDGQGYTIKNLNVDNSAATDKHTSSGLFGWAEANVTIKNVNVDGATVKGNHNVAVIVGYTYSGKISGCNVTNASIVCTHANDDACGDKCGLIAGYAGNESRISDCSASDSTVTAGRDAGQLIGAGYNVSVSGCTATGVTVTAGGDCPDEKNIGNTLIGRVLG